MFSNWNCLSPKNSKQESRDESQVYHSPTLPQRDFNDPGPKNEEFCPNPGPTQTNNSPQTPDMILSTSEKSLQHYKTEGCSANMLQKLISLSVLKNNFCGWIVKSEISSRPRLKNGFYFVQNDPATEDEMIHCTVLFVTGDYYEYFDSNGVELHEIPGVKVISNKIQFQHPFYNTCGIHAVYFLRERDKLGSMKKVQESYPSYTEEFKDLEMNEEHVFEYLKQIDDPQSFYATHAIYIDINPPSSVVWV